MTEDQTPKFFRGEWLVPADAGYDEARLRIFNTRRDPHPPVVARCLGNADVIAALAHAREQRYDVAVRCTGWNFEGWASTDGLTIDLSLMRGIRIDPVAQTACIQGGVKGGDLQIEAARYNLAAPSGIFSGTGVGVMLGGGVGHLSRRIGYHADNILAVELVTAAGEVVVASPEENPDLFWAVRGTQGNFGVVTGLTVQLHQVPDLVLAGEISWEGARFREVFRTLTDAAEWASDDLNVIASFERGRSSIRVCHSGPSEVATAELARLMEIGAPDTNTVAPTSFRDLTFALDDEYGPMRVALDHEIQTTALTDEIAEAIETLLQEPSVGNGDGMRIIEAMPCFRGMSRAPRHPNAIHDGLVPPHWAMYPIAAWWGDASEDGAYEKWVFESVSTLRSAADRSGVRTQSFGLQAVGSPEACYGDSLPRLRELKRTWDPQNVFRANLNIDPAPAER